jgi:hypothetical protein
MQHRTDIPKGYLIADPLEEKGDLIADPLQEK